MVTLRMATVALLSSATPPPLRLLLFPEMVLLISAMAPLQALTPPPLAPETVLPSTRLLLSVVLPL